MLEGPAVYPLMRRRRRVPLSRRIRRLATGRTGRLVALAALVALVVWGVVQLAERANRPDTVQAYADGEAALARGNYSAARNHFADAVAAAPGNGRAQAELARTYLLLGEGVPAQGALDRAAQAGVASARLHHLRAAALLLQDDPDGAIAEARQARGAFVPYARRIYARALAAKSDNAGAIRVLVAATRLDPRDAAAWSDLGRLRLNAGDIGGASVAAQRAAQLDRTDLAALTLLGEVVRSQYGLTAALPWFEAALKRDAFFHPALIEYAGTLGDIGRYGDSLRAARAALQSRPNSPQALYLMAVIAARAGDRPLARDLLDHTGGALDGLPGGLLLSGGLDYAAGDYEQAVVKWRALLGRQPMNLAARRLLGAALLRSGDARGTLAVLRPIALRADADSYTLALVGRAFEATGERGWAAPFLDRAARPQAREARPFGQDDDTSVLAVAVNDAPDDPGVAVSYLRGLLERGDGTAALAAAQRLAAATPGAPVAQLLVGDILATNGRFAAAAQSYARAAQLAFDTPTLLRLVEAWSASGDAKRATDALALFLAQNPSEPDARRLLANGQLASGEFNAAVDTLEGLRADLGSHDAVLLAQLAYAYTGAGDPAAALRYARAAYALQPMSAGVCDAYGWALYERGDTAAALQLLAKAARIAPAHAGIQWHLGQALADAGDGAAARRAIGSALKAPGFTDRAAATRLLASLPAA